MLRFIIRRLLVTIPMVLVVLSLTWGLIRLAPGNFYSGERALPPAIEQNIRAKYGLDRPWYVQYGKMIGEYGARRLRHVAPLRGPDRQRDPGTNHPGVGGDRAHWRICWRSSSA